MLRADATCGIATMTGDSRDEVNLFVDSGESGDEEKVKSWSPQTIHAKGSNVQFMTREHVRMNAAVDQGKQCAVCGCDSSRLSDPFCRNCGRRSDSAQALAVVEARQIPDWARSAIAPPGFLFHFAVCIASFAMLVSGAWPGSVFAVAAGAGLCLFALGAIWVTHGILRLAAVVAYRQPMVPPARDYRRWLLAPGVVIATGVVFMLRLPLWLTFLISLPWLNGFVKQAENALLGSPIPHPAWMGVYPVAAVSRNGANPLFGEGGLTITVRGAGSVGAGGFMHCPTSVPQSNAERAFRRMFGDWYEWWDDF